MVKGLIILSIGMLALFFITPIIFREEDKNDKPNNRR